MPSKATCCPKHLSATHILPLRLRHAIARDQLRHLAAEHQVSESGLRQGQKAIALPKSFAQKATAASVQPDSIHRPKQLSLAACCLCCIRLGTDGFLSPAPHQVWELAALGQPVSRRCILTAHLPAWPQSKLPHAV